MTSQARPASAVSSLWNRAMTLSRSLKVGTTTDNSGVTTAVPCPVLMASFMRQRISPAPVNAKPQQPKDRPGRGKTGQKCPKNANDHEQRAHVHPAQPNH